MRRLLGRALTVLVVCSAISGCTPAERVGSAPRDKVVCLHSDGETYQSFAWLLCSYLEERLGDRYRYEVTSSPGDDYSLTGAMDILESIARSSVQSGTYYLGLTQTDVAHAFLEGGHPLYELPHLRREQVVTLAPALPEYLHIYSAFGADAVLQPGSDSPTYDQHEATWRSLYLGALGSGTLLTAVRLFPILSERDLSQPREELNQERAVFTVRRARTEPDRSPNREGWGGFLVSGSPVAEVASRLEAGEGTLVSLRAEQQRHITTVYSQIYRAHTLHYPTASNPDQAFVSVEIPALLVAPKATPENIVLSALQLFKSIADADGSESDMLEQVLRSPTDRKIKRPPRVTDESLAHVIAAVRRYHHRRSGLSETLSPVLPLHRSVLNLPRWNYVLPGAIAVIGFALLFWACRSAWLLWRSRTEPRGWFDLNPWLVLACATLGFTVWSHACIAAVIFLEHRAYMAYQTEEASLLVTQSIFDNYLLILRNLVSGLADERLFPSGLVGRALLLTVPLFLVVATAVSIMQLVVPPAVHHLAKKLQRSRPMKLENHVLFCYWHRHTPQVIQMLEDHARLEGREREAVAVLLPAREPINVPVTGEHVSDGLGRYFVYAVPPSSENAGHGFSNFYAIEGMPSQEAALRLARATKARAIILFPNPDHIQPDSETLLTALTLARLIREEEARAQQAQESFRPPRVIAWCADPDHIATFRQEPFGLSDVCSAEWAWRLVCQATYVDHISNVYRRLMTSSATTNEIYEIELPGDFEPLEFGEIQERLIAFNRKNADLLTFEVDGCRDGSGGVERAKKRNTLVPLGFARASDPRKDDLQLNPNPEAEVVPGSRLLLLAFRLDAKVREAVLTALGPAHKA